MSQEATQDDIATMSFEDALSELEKIVKTLETGSGKLDAAIDAYDRGAALKRHCEAKLREAERRIEKITLDSSGQARAEPANIGG